MSNQVIVSEADNRMSTIQLIGLAIGMGLGMFVEILDTSIANVAIPHIAGFFGITPSDGTWVITSYAISNAIVIPITGRLAYRFDESRIFIISMFLFVLFSLLCALAWSFASLVLFRILQGIAGGAILSLSQSLVLQIYPKNIQGLILGGLSAIMVIAPILGPILGGWLTDRLSWPWIFYINIPIGLLSVFLVMITLGFGRRKIMYKKYDVIGFCLLAVMIGSLQIFLDRGHDLDWFNSTFITTLALTFFITLLFFVAWNSYNEDPLVNLSLFRNTNFTIGTLLISTIFSLTFGGAVLTTLWTQTQLNYPALTAGLTIAPLGVALLFIGGPIGYWITILDARWFISIGTAIIGLSFFWFASFNNEVSLYQLMISRAFQGIGISLVTLPLTALATNEISKIQYINAISLFHFIRIVLSCGVAVAIFSSAWQHLERYHRDRLLEEVSSFTAKTEHILQTAENLGFSEHASAALINRTVIHQSFLLSLNDLFWLSGWIALSLTPLPWLCRYTPLQPDH